MALEAERKVQVILCWGYKTFSVSKWCITCVTKSIISTIIRPRLVDHLLKICVLNLWYVRTGDAKNAQNVKGMLFPMYGVFYLHVTTFSSIYELIEVRPVTIACKTAKLFTISHRSTQLRCTIVHDDQAYFLKKKGLQCLVKVGASVGWAEDSVLNLIADSCYHISSLMHKYWMYMSVRIWFSVRSAFWSLLLLRPLHEITCFSSLSP